MANSEVIAPGEPSAASQALVARAPWWMLPMLAIIAEASFILAMWLAFKGEDKTLQNLMAFATVTQAALAFGYFYTSSLGSQTQREAAVISNATKDSLLAASTAALAASSPAVPATEPPAPAAPATSSASRAMRPTGISDS